MILAAVASDANDRVITMSMTNDKEDDDFMTVKVRDLNLIIQKFFNDKINNDFRIYSKELI